MRHSTVQRINNHSSSRPVESETEIGPFCLRNSYDRRYYRTTEELELALVEGFMLKHVSITYPRKPRGLLRTLFVSIDERGTIRHTYGDQSRVSFRLIDKEVMNHA